MRMADDMAAMSSSVSGASLRKTTSAAPDRRFDAMMSACRPPSGPPAPEHSKWNMRCSSSSVICMQQGTCQPAQLLHLLYSQIDSKSS